MRSIDNRKSKIGNTSDPRHQELMREIDWMYRRYNDGLPAPDMARTAKALHAFLQANPGWSFVVIRRAIRNRFYSRAINLSEQPWAWIKFLPRYVADPLDEWKKPMRGKGNEVQREWEEILAEEGQRPSMFTTKTQRH
jgi:hypothetical protein